LTEFCNFNSDNPLLTIKHHCTSFKKTDVSIVTVECLDIVNGCKTALATAHIQKCRPAISI